MTEVIQFIEDFVTLEHEVAVQIRSDPRTSLVENNLNKLNEFFQGLDSEYYVPSPRPLEEPSEVLKQLQPRVLFKIEQYAHAALGTIYRAYLSLPFRGAHDYFSSHLVAHTDKGLKIIARYNICNHCDGIGVRVGVVCDECDGAGWNWRGGQKLASFGDLVAVREFVRPTARE